VAEADALQPFEWRRVSFALPTVEFRHAGDKYADLIQEAIDNLGMDFNDVKFVTPEDDPAATTVRHDGGLSPHGGGGGTFAARFDWTAQRS